MNTFAWIGIDRLGNKIIEEIVALNKSDAQQKLALREITVLSLKKINFTAFQRSLTPAHIVDFTQQLQLLLQTGIPLVDALSLIGKTTTNTRLITLITTLKEKMRAGATLANALREFPSYFNQTYCHIIAAGEKSGQLENVLLQLIEMITQQLRVKRKIVDALFYPVIVLGVTLFIAAGMLIFVIPQISMIYSSFGATLPSLTQTVITLSDFLRHHIFLCCSLMIILIGIATQITKPLKKMIQAVLFAIPSLRDLIITRHIAQWCQLLSTTLAAHIPLVDAIQMANETISQRILQKQLDAVRKALISGQSFYHALNLCPYFPIRAKHLIAIGENADALDILLKKIAALYHQQLTDRLTLFSKLIEPAMMLGVAGLIAGLIVALYLPIFRMGSII